jgi:hypothetical protein
MPARVVDARWRCDRHAPPLHVPIWRSTAIAAAALALAVTNLAAQVASVTVQGRVVERGTTIGIPAAGVELVGTARVVTDANGGFRFPSVVPGRHVVVIERLGYQAQEVPLIIRVDTTLIIELDVTPVQLDTIEVRTRRITLKGRVVDRESGRGLLDADVFVSPDRSTVTGSSGGFRVSRVPAARTVRVTVQALSYLPVTIEFLAERDTTLRFELEPDPIGRRMIAAQVARLETRSNAVAYAKRAVHRDELVRKANWTIADIVKSHLAGRLGVQCVILDDQLLAFGMIQLETYLPDELERIEIIDRGTMLRVYTRRYIQRLMSNRPLAPIVLVKTPRGVICR